MSDRYYCESCERTFDEYNEIYEPDGLDTPPYRCMHVCPFCNSDDFRVIIGECSYCGNSIYVGDRYYELSDDCYTLYCENCITEKR